MTRPRLSGAFGIQVKETLWLQGQYDLMAISEAPDEMTGTALTLNTVRHGNVHSITMRAFTAAEMEKILEKVE